jgi:hypothetical protein
MKIPDVYTTFSDGEVFFDEEKALAQLLLDGVIFINDTKYVFGDEIRDEWVIFCAVNCNDVFYWACADAESIETDDLQSLYDHHVDESNGGWGSTKWVCKKRNLKPQKPIVERMKSEGVWDDEMEKLQDNN